jgi:TonB-linked SusC/RagA family outer membrane protein
MKFYDLFMRIRELILHKQILRIMRLTIIIITCCLMQVSAAGYGQNITLKRANTTLEKVFEEIRKQSGYDFFYDADLSLGNKKISLELKNADIDGALKIALSGHPYTYAIENKTVVITKKDSFLDKAKSVILNLVQDLIVRGRVVDERGNPLPNASIQIKGKAKVYNSNDNGEFSIPDVAEDAVLVIRYIGYKPLEVPLKGAVMPLEVKLNVATGELEEVKVTYNTGYQTLPKERATGSFAYIDNKTFNQQTGTNILERLNGVASGVLFDYTKDKGTNNKLNFSVRGLSTINGPTDPLIVIDNFIYEGDINNINPNDIEGVTILKDAAATSIYGARGGNGVVVFTTKKGKFNQATTVNFNASVRLTEKPDLFYLPQISSREYVEMEQFLFNNGYYNGAINNTDPTALITPAVDIFSQLKRGLIPKADSARLINQLASVDSRAQYNKYFYGTGITQLYGLGLRGGSDKLAWNLSAGIDRDINNLDAKSNKFNLRFGNVYRPVKNLQISVGALFTSDKDQTGKEDPKLIEIGVKHVPYLNFADENGSSLPLARFYRQSYIDNVGGGKLLNWNYYPLEDYKHSYTKSNRKELLANFGLNYAILKWLNLDIKYQNQQQKNDHIVTRDKESFYTRDLVNKFTQIDPVTVGVKRIIPVGDIATFISSSVHSQAFRGQLNFDQHWSDHEISAFLGTEVREIIDEGNTYTVYGYKKDPLTQATLDYQNLYPKITGGSEAIPGAPLLAPTINNRFLSFYGNGAYVYKKKYVLSGSLRRDGANVLGAKTNDKFTPLWSAGASWVLSAEDFYHLKAIPYLQLRATYGYSGNVDLLRTALPTAIFSTNSATNLPFGYINQLNNPELRWEKVSTLNLKLDFSLKNNVLTGSVEYFVKHGSDLYGQTPYDYTAFGRSQNVIRNAAGMKGSGIELILNSRNINGKDFNWTTGLLFNYYANKTTKYYTDESLKIGNLLGGGSNITPIVGKPLYAIAAYKWGGLDANGNPQSYVNGQKSIDYVAISEEGLNKGLEGNIVYVGTAFPSYYGALSNTLRWKNIEASFNVSYKMGYYFIKPTIDYTSLANSGTGNSEYSARWQKAGDEVRTNVPSFLYPIDSAKGGIYANSEINVLKGDHIRLQYVNIGYQLDKMLWKNSGFKNFRVFVNAADLGILWRANKYNLDPDFPAVLRPSGSITFGINSNF